MAALVAGGCTSGAGASGAPTAHRDPPATPAAGALRITRPDHVVDVTPPAGGCAVGGPCQLGLEVFALGDFKINRDYPSRFVPAAGAPVLDGAGASLAVTAANVGTLTVAVRTTAAAMLNVDGTLKFGICNADRCENYATPIALGIAVR